MYTVYTEWGQVDEEHWGRQPRKEPAFIILPRLPLPFVSILRK